VQAWLEQRRFLGGKMISGKGLFAQSCSISYAALSD